MILIFHLGLGQGSPIMDAPVDRFQALIDVTLIQKIHEGTGDDGLIVGAHCEIWIIPAAEYAEPDEILALQIDVLHGVFPAGGTDFRGSHTGFF